MSGQREIHCASPMGELALRTWCMPQDTNPSGDIFGGWLLGQMDIAGAMTASREAGGRIATVGINEMSFHLPVNVGDTLCCYTTVERIGTTSITIRVEAWVTRRHTEEHTKVTEGMFTYVAVDSDGNKRPVKG